MQRAPRVRAARVGAERRRFPTAPAWLVAQVVETAPFGTQLAHLLTDTECQAFLAAVPQAGRIFRPLFRMLGVVPVPEAVRKRASPVYDDAVGVLALDGGCSSAMEGRLFSRG